MAETGTDHRSSLLSEVVGKNRFDDRVDTSSDIDTLQAFDVIGRAVGLIGHVKGLFTAKFLLQLGLVFPGLLLPWLAKILTDNVILANPVDGTDVVYPPFMDPVIAMVEGKGPLDILLVLTATYACLLAFFGLRAGGTGAGLLQGRDASTQAENAISAGRSSGSGLWGLLEFMVHVRMTQTMANRLRSRLFDRLARLPLTVLDDQRIGDSVFRVLYDVPSAPDLAYRVTLEPFFFALSAIINLYILQYSYGEVAPELIWIAWLTVPVAFLITFPFSGALRRTNQNKRAAGAAATNAMEESMSNIGAVQSLGGAAKEHERFAERSDHMFLRERYAMAVIIVSALIAGGAFGIAGIYVLILVTDRIFEGTMSVGDYWVLIGVFSGIVAPAGYFGAIWIKLQETIAAVRRVLFFLDHEIEDDRMGGQAVGPVREGVRFEDVGFVYAGGARALGNVSLELSVGELVAIVGPTGAGKTTLAYLLPALLVPTSGRLLIDGQDVTDCDLQSLRQQVTYVFQEHVLLSESIRDNLRLANPDASAADMMGALAAAGCLDFIRELPEGIDTCLGRSGDTLSVGEQQRLSIARGLVRGSSILILDEPTAALDPKTENELIASLRAAGAGRLVIVIAHRLSTIREADRIVFLEDGEIKDLGSHEELMARPTSPYREFVELQGG